MLYDSSSSPTVDVQIFGDSADPLVNEETTVVKYELVDNVDDPTVSETVSNLVRMFKLLYHVSPAPAQLASLFFDMFVVFSSNTKIEIEIQIFKHFFA